MKPSLLTRLTAAAVLLAANAAAAPVLLISIDGLKPEYVTQADEHGLKVPNLRRIMMPEDWEGHPLRKDYPLGYEEPQFSFNFEEIDLRKPYVKE